MRVALAAWLLACAPLAPAQAEDPASWMGVKGASAERVRVPVFNGDVVLYRAGKRGAEPIILIHGLGRAGARDWAEVIPALASSYDVYALDLPGFGASGKGNHLYSPSNYVRVLDVVFGERLKRPAVFVGHSMGGVIALAYATAYPDRVRRLIVADVAGVLHRSVYGEFLGRAVTERALGDSPWYDAVIKLIVTQAENLPSKGVMSIEQPQVRQRLLRGDPNAIAALALVEHDLSRGLRAIRVPTLVVWTSDDRVAPPRTGQVLASVIPGARLVVIGEGGHAPQISVPARFNAVLRDELRGKLEAKPYAQPLAPPAPGRSGRCTSERGRQFSGDYDEIVIEGCVEVEISDARVGKLMASRSHVRIVNSHVRDGVESHDSRLEFTGGSLGGDPPLVLDETNIDAAGLRFMPRGRVVAENYGDATITLRLSVAEIAGGKGEPRYAHQILRLVADQSWTPRGAR
jgi:pimeloyl-ACP methyl ester carboxylesterase